MFECELVVENWHGVCESCEFVLNCFEEFDC